MGDDSSGGTSPAANLTVLPGKASAMLRWSAPPDNGKGPITGYLVTVSEGGAPCLNVAVEETAYTARKLDDTKHYTFAVAARRQPGGAPEEVGRVDDVTVQPATTPAEPREVTAIARNRSVQVCWNPPEDDGGRDILRYTVTPRTSNAELPPVVEAATARRAVVAGLENGKSYSVAVTAANERGTGPGRATTFVTPQETGPDAPTDVRARPEKGAAVVEWRAPESDGGSGVTAYRVDAHSAAGTTTRREVKAGPPPLTARVIDLDERQTYTVTVTAKNKMGWGLASTASAKMQPGAPEAPGKPTDVVLTFGNKKARISWTPLTEEFSGGRSIEDYKISVISQPSGSSAIAPTLTDATQNEHIFDHLANNKCYKFAVQARNNRGPGQTFATKEGRPHWWLRLDGKRPIRAWLAGLFLALAIVAQAVQTAFQVFSWPFWPILLSLSALLVSALWIVWPSPERGDAATRRTQRVCRVAIVGTCVFVVLVVSLIYAIYGWPHHQFLWLAGRCNFVWTPTWAALWSGFVVVMGIPLVHGWMRWKWPVVHPDDFRPQADDPLSETEQRRRNACEFRTAGLKGVVVGADGLASTSRLMPALWTVALIFAVLHLLLVGRTPHCPNPLPLEYVNPDGVVGSCHVGGLEIGGGNFADQLGTNFPWTYLLLIGFPVAAAVVAKRQAITFGDRLKTATLDEATTPMIEKPEESVGLRAGLAQVISDDNGQGSLVNFQYFAFTLVTIAFVLIEVVAHPEHGLPEIPTALLVLSGVAVGGYLTNRQIKGTTTPNVTS